MYSLLRPLLHALDPETAHGVAISGLKTGLHPRGGGNDDDGLGIDLFGLSFPNPLGMAAGFDKNAEVPDALLALGFGFAEAGTVTPKPQSGNPKPRIFRLSEDRAMINRLGFNNEGHERVHARLAKRARTGIVGVNIGANKDTVDRAGDYVEGLTRFYDVASYFTVNISSPNTPGLRGLQAREPLVDLVTRLTRARELLSEEAGPKAILLKVAPDLEDDDVDTIAVTCLHHGIDGLIVSNTTIARSGLRSNHANEEGGLSGKPLFDRSTDMLARFYRATGGALPLVGVGGIDSADAAYEKITCGASLLQLYTGMVYEGPELVARIKRGLRDRLRRDGHSHIEDAVGTRSSDRAAHGDTT